MFAVFDILERNFSTLAQYRKRLANQKCVSKIKMHSAQICLMTYTMAYKIKNRQIKKENPMFDKASVQEESIQPLGKYWLPKFLSVILLILISLDCAPLNYVSPPTVTPAPPPAKPISPLKIENLDSLAYESSNQYAIEKALANINIGEKLRSYVPANSLSALVSMETYSTGDEPIVAAVEDQLILSLLGSKIKIVERDIHLIVRMISEKKGNSYHYIIDPADTFVTSATTQLTSADYIISYRILELGVRYFNISKISRDTTVHQGSSESLDYSSSSYSSSSSSYIRRFSFARLHVRLQNSKTGEIIYANNLNGSNYDTIRKGDVDSFEDYHFTFFGNNYPLQK